jgi:Domain of unknown function (DUF4202)
VRRLSDVVDGLPLRYRTAVEAIDQANADDPTVVTVRGEPVALALAHGRLAAAWIERLLPDPSEAVRLAARAHHLRRWELPRTRYPAGRAGYLRWRRDQKRRHADDVAALMAGAGYDDATVARTQALIRRDGLGTSSTSVDAETQAVEDAACLVFLETQLSDMAARIEHQRMIDVIRKTAAKMSPAALDLVATVPLDADASALLAEALEAPRK